MRYLLAALALAACATGPVTRPCTHFGAEVALTASLRDGDVTEPVFPSFAAPASVPVPRPPARAVVTVHNGRADQVAVTLRCVRSGHAGLDAVSEVTSTVPARTDRDLYFVIPRTRTRTHLSCEISSYSSLPSSP